MPKLRVTAKRGGKRISYLTKDKGKPGRTPKRKRWFEPGVKMGWEKDMPMAKRRGLVLKAHGGDYLATARALQALANVTTDRETKKKAKAEATPEAAVAETEGPAATEESEKAEAEEAEEAVDEAPKET